MIINIITTDSTSTKHQGLTGLTSSFLLLFGCSTSAAMASGLTSQVVECIVCGINKLHSIPCSRLQSLESTIVGHLMSRELIFLT